MTTTNKTTGDENEAVGMVGLFSHSGNGLSIHSPTCHVVAFVRRSGMRRFEIMPGDVADVRQRGYVVRVCKCAERREGEV